jgi:very-short-patch-repair endonuclease
MKLPDIIKEISRQLRSNMTESEIILWSFIKWSKIWVRFQRQKPIHIFNENNWLNRYIIPDFYCHNKKIILEIDWSIHNLKEIYELDLHKEQLLLNIWFKVIRIKNEEIKNNINNVIKTIKSNL